MAGWWLAQMGKIWVDGGYRGVGWMAWAACPTGWWLGNRARSMGNLKKSGTMIPDLGGRQTGPPVVLGWQPASPERKCRY